MPSFKEAFAAARGAKKKTFKWEGKLYTTELKEDGPARPKARPTAAPKTTERPKARPTAAPKTTERPKARPTSAPKTTERPTARPTSAPSSTPRPQARPAAASPAPTPAKAPAAAAPARRIVNPQADAVAAIVVDSRARRAANPRRSTPSGNSIVKRNWLGIPINRPKS